MTDGKSRVWADEVGLWREDRPGVRFGIEWADVHSISVSKLAPIDEVFTILQLDWSFGEYIELGDYSAGFEAVVEAVANRFVGLEDRLKASIANVQPGETLVVWTREAPVRGTAGEEEDW